MCAGIELEVGMSGRAKLYNLMSFLTEALKQEEEEEEEAASFPAGCYEGRREGLMAIWQLPFLSIHRLFDQSETKHSGLCAHTMYHECVCVRSLQPETL